MCQVPELVEASGVEVKRGGWDVRAAGGVVRLHPEACGVGLDQPVGRGEEIRVLVGGREPWTRREVLVP